MTTHGTCICAAQSQAGWSWTGVGAQTGPAPGSAEPAAAPSSEPPWPPLPASWWRSPKIISLVSYIHSNIIQQAFKNLPLMNSNSNLIWVFSFLSAASTPCNLRTSWYAHCSSSSRCLLNLMASSSCPSREERISFSSLRSGSLISRFLATLLAESPAALLSCPLILWVGTSFPWINVMEVLGFETVGL